MAKRFSGVNSPKSVAARLALSSLDRAWGVSTWQLREFMLDEPGFKDNVRIDYPEITNHQRGEVIKQLNQLTQTFQNRLKKIGKI